MTCHVTPKWVEGCAHAQPEVGGFTALFSSVLTGNDVTRSRVPSGARMRNRKLRFPALFSGVFLFSIFFFIFFFFYLFFYFFFSVLFFSLFFFFFFFEYRKMKSFYNVTQVTLDFKCCSLKKYGKKDAVFS